MESPLCQIVNFSLPLECFEGIPLCGAGFFLSDQKETKESPGRPRAIPLRYPRRPRTPITESRRPCVDCSLQNMRALTPPFASQNGEDFTGDKQYSPPRWRQRLTAVASYLPGPTGPPEGASNQQSPLQNGRLSVLAGGNPRLLTPRRAFHKEKQAPITLAQSGSGRG